MIFTKQGFLEAYSCLAQGVQKQHANQYILALERSEQAWRIACELIEDTQLSNRLYGAQLFSKRVSSGLPANTDPLEAVRFLYATIQKNSNEKLIVGQLCLSIAKILASSIPCLERFVQDVLRENSLPLCLSIVKELPQCLSHSEKSILLEVEDRKKLYMHVEPVIVEGLNDQARVADAIACLQNFAQFCQIRVARSQRMIETLVRLPIQRTCTLLAECFSELTEGSINSATVDALVNYVLKASQQTNPSPNFKSMFLQFIRFYITHDLHMPFANLQHILSKTLEYIASDREHITNSFEFWMDLEKYAEQRQDCSQLIFQAMLQLNKIVVVQSKLSKLIPRNTTTDQPPTEVVDLDADSVEDDLDPLALGCQTPAQADGCLSFRESAFDFLLLCFRCIRKVKDVEVKYFQDLECLMGQDPLCLELCIFVLKSIVDQLTPEEYPLTYPIFNKVFSAYEMLPDELLVPFLQLLFDSDKVLFSDDKLFVAALLFFNKSFQNEKLIRLSTQTLSNIMSQLNVVLSTLKSTIEEFTGLVYAQLENYSDETVIENLVNSVITLITKFENSSSTYAQFLTNYSMKVFSLSPNKRLMHYKALFSTHHRIVQDHNLHQVMSTFIIGYYHNILSDYFSEQEKKPKLQYMMVFSLIAKSCGQYIPTVMLDIATQLLMEASNRNFVETGSLYFLSSILSYELSIVQSYLPFLRTVWLPINTALFSMPLTPQRAKILVELGSKLVPLTEDHSAYMAYALKALRNVPFNYQLIREILRYFVIITMNTQVDLHEILREILSRYELYCDPFSRTLTDLLIEIFKRGGQKLFADVLQSIKPILLPPNPLFSTLVTALREGDAKTIKNILTCLRT